MRKVSISLVALLVGTLAVVSMSRGGGDKAATGSKAAIGQPAPQFSLSDQDGKQVSLSDYSGKIVVLEWFNNECPFVVRHYKAGDMNATASKYAAKDVVWLAINTTAGKTQADNKAIAGQWKIDRPILADSDGTVAKSYGAKTTPHMFIIDKQGTLAYMGGIDNDPQGDKSADKVNYVDKALTELLNGSTVSEPQTKSYGCSVKYAK